MQGDKLGSRGSIDGNRHSVDGEERHPRAVGAPLPVGSGERMRLPQPLARGAAEQATGRALGNQQMSSQHGEPELPSGMQRAVSTIRALLPYVQKILPLLDGNIGTAVANVLAPHPHTPPPAPPINLAPIEDSLVALESRHHELRGQIAEQNSSLKRVEDQLEMVREATDRNTREQQELLEDLKGIRTKINLFAFIAIVLLGVSVLINVILYLHIRRIFP
jgi:hypothetical protein